MQLTQKLLGHLYRAFNKTPDAVLALRLRYDGAGMTWAVTDGVLTTRVSGGSGAGLSVDLAAYTLSGLVSHLAAQPGYTVVYSNRALDALSARVLIDGTGDQDASNGDWLMAYQSLLWVYLEPLAVELRRARLQITEMLRQMNTKSAEGEWLDLLGSYYYVPRLPGESDAAYGPRIIIETLRPRSNNVALGTAIRDYSGQAATVIDVTIYGETFPRYNGAIRHDGTETHSNAAMPVYGLFDVEVGFDLIGGAPPNEFRDLVRDLVNRLRAAGTQLRSVLLRDSVLIDTLRPPTDGGNQVYAGGLAFADTLPPPTEATPPAAGALGLISDVLPAPDDATDVLVQIYTGTHNGMRRHNGAVRYSSGKPLAGSISGDGPLSQITVWDDGATTWDDGITYFVRDE